MIQTLCNSEIDKTIVQKDQIQFTKGEDERNQEKIIKQNIKIIVTIITRVIIMVTLITKEKLRLLLLRNSRKSPYITPIFQSTIKYIFERVMSQD